MRQIHTAANPFMMITDPEVILHAVTRSARLNGLARRVCRPLDRPLIPKIQRPDLAFHDAEIDADDAEDMTQA